MQALWMALGALSFSLMGMCIKLASAHYSTMEVLLFRGAVGMALFYGLLRWRGIQLATPCPQLHIKRNIAGVVSMSLWFYAIAKLPFATAMMLNNMSSVWVGCLVLIESWWLTRKLVHTKLFVVLLMGFGGVVLLLNPNSQDTHTLLPASLGLFSGLLAAVAYKQVRSLGEAGEPELRTVFYFSCGTALMGLVGILISQQGFTTWQHANFWALPATGVFASIGQWCLTRAYTKGATLVVSNLQYLGLVFSALLGVFLFQEHLSASRWFGMAIIVCCGIAATILRPRTPAASG